MTEPEPSDDEFDELSEAEFDELVATGVPVMVVGLGDFFEEDEPAAEVWAAFDDGVKQQTHGSGWCAPSP